MKRTFSCRKDSYLSLNEGDFLQKRLYAEGIYFPGWTCLHEDDMFWCVRDKTLSALGLFTLIEWFQGIALLKIKAMSLIPYTMYI